MQAGAMAWQHTKQPGWQRLGSNMGTIPNGVVSTPEGGGENTPSSPANQEAVLFAGQSFEAGHRISHR